MGIAERTLVAQGTCWVTLRHFFPPQVAHLLYRIHPERPQKLHRLPPAVLMHDDECKGFTLMINYSPRSRGELLCRTLFNKILQSRFRVLTANISCPHTRFQGLAIAPLERSRRATRDSVIDQSLLLASHMRQTRRMFSQRIDESTRYGAIQVAVVKTEPLVRRPQGYRPATDIA